MVKVKKTITKITTDVKISPTQDQKPERRRGCAFCQSNNKPSYFDIAVLKRYLSERGKILPKGYTKACSKHQRAVSRQIKYARHLALLPFTPKV